MPYQSFPHDVLQNAPQHVLPHAPLSTSSLRIFHQFAYGIYPLYFCLKVIGSFGKFFVIHLLRMLTEKILHEPSKWCVVTIRPIDVKNMSSTIIWSLKLLYDALDMAKRTTRSIDIVFCNEDDPRLWKCRELWLLLPVPVNPSCCCCSVPDVKLRPHSPAEPRSRRVFPRCLLPTRRNAHRDHRDCPRSAV